MHVNIPYIESLYQFLQLLPIIDQTNSHVPSFTCRVKKHITLLYDQIRIQFKYLHNAQNYIINEK